MAAGCVPLYVSIPAGSGSLLFCWNVSAQIVAVSSQQQSAYLMNKYAKKENKLETAMIRMLI